MPRAEALYLLRRVFSRLRRYRTASATITLQVYDPGLRRNGDLFEFRELKIVGRHNLGNFA